MFFTEIKTRLAKELMDTDNATFTDDEKSEALTKAIEEELVAVREEDTLTFTNGTRSYPMDENIRAVYSVGIDASGGTNPIPLDAEAYIFRYSSLVFSSRYIAGIPTNALLYVDQLRKLTVEDDIPPQILPYVLNQAIYYTTEFLATRKITRFLRNDTTMAEIIQRGQMAQREANRLRKALPARNFVEV